MKAAKVYVMYVFNIKNLWGKSSPRGGEGPLLPCSPNVAVMDRVLAGGMLSIINALCCIFGSDTRYAFVYWQLL